MKHLLFAAITLSAVVSACLPARAITSAAPPFESTCAAPPIAPKAAEAFAPLPFMSFKLAPATGSDEISAPADKAPLPGSKTLVGKVLALFAAFTCLGIVNQRSTRDTNLQITTALPAAGANSDSASIDTGTTTPGRIPGVELSLVVAAVPALVDAKTIIYTFKDSADNITFTAIADLPTITSTGAGGVGAAAIDRRFKLPINTRQYINVNRSVLAAGGDNTAVSSVLGLVF